MEASADIVDFNSIISIKTRQELDERSESSSMTTPVVINDRL